MKNTIKVYDIHALSTRLQPQKDIIAERFSDYLAAQPPGLHHLHRHSFYHLVLFTKGSGTHSVDFEQFEVRPKGIYFMRPGQVHSWNFKSAADGYIVNFSEHLFDLVLKEQQYPEQFFFFKGIASESVLQLHTTVYKQASVLLEQLLRETSQRDEHSTDMICTLLMSLFITIERGTGRNNGGSIPAHKQLVLQQFRKLLDLNYTEKRLPKEYAAMLYITPNHLNALCNDLLGKSAGTLIRERILLEAKRLLVNASLSIAEVAWQLHFEDNSYFSRFFKKYTGLTPEAFRLQQTKQ